MPPSSYPFCVFPSIFTVTETVSASGTSVRKMFVAPFPVAHSLPPVGQMLRLSSSGLSLHIPLVSFLISKASDKTIPASLITTSFLAVIPLDAVALTSTAPAAFAVSTPSAEISAADVLSPVLASATL